MRMRYGFLTAVRPPSPELPDDPLDDAPEDPLDPADDELPPLYEPPLLEPPDARCGPT